MVFSFRWYIEFLGSKRRAYWNDVYDDSMGIRGHARSWTNRFWTVRSIDLVEMEYWCRCFDLLKVNSSNPRFGGDEFAGLNYHKKAGSVHVGICATIEMPAFFSRRLDYSDALGRLNRLLVSLVKRNYKWRLRNSGITVSLGRGRVTDQLRVILRQFLLECYRRSGDQNRFYTAHSGWSSRTKRIHWTSSFRSGSLGVNCSQIFIHRFYFQFFPHLYCKRNETLTKIDRKSFENHVFVSPL